ncbi:MAG: hypothetical protein Q8P22_11570 [Chloroflexota bacterium]|nr:hypothetical protein [Chloroflexota bacterium]
MAEMYYRANVKLLIPNGPGAVPSSVRVAAGEVFILDGTEPLNIPMLIASGAAQLLDGPPPQKVNIMPTRKRRKN